jgi:hypothetical protein
MKRIIIMLVASLILVSSAKAGRKNDAAIATIATILKSAELMKDYRDYRIEVYDKVTEVKGMSFPETKLAGIKQAYANNQQLCDAFYSKLISDLLDKKTRNEMRDNPDAFDEKYGDQYKAIKTDYKENFLVEYTLLTEKPASWLSEGISVIKKIVEMIRGMVKINKDLIVNKFKKPLMLKDWSKVEQKVVDDLVKEKKAADSNN